MHSPWFKAIKLFYGDGLYTKEQVAIFVAKNRITKEEYLEITGEEYTEE